MKGTNETVVTARVLVRCQREILGFSTEYSLWVEFDCSQPHYRIRVERGAESSSCDVGEGLINAVHFFEAVVNGEVFPYSLTEIAEDFFGT